MPRPFTHTNLPIVACPTGRRAISDTRTGELTLYRLVDARLVSYIIEEMIS
jgi:hypothetical protein